MCKYFIEVVENENGLYDFYIDFINEESMTDIYRIGTRLNIEDLGEIFKMVEEFPLASPTSELTSVTLHRRNPNVKPNMLEILFTISMNDLVKKNSKIKEFNLE